MHPERPTTYLRQAQPPQTPFLPGAWAPAAPFFRSTTVMRTRRCVHKARNPTSNHVMRVGSFYYTMLNAVVLRHSVTVCELLLEQALLVKTCSKHKLLKIPTNRIFRSEGFFGYFGQNFGIRGAEHHKRATLTQPSPTSFPVIQ